MAAHSSRTVLRALGVVATSSGVFPVLPVLVFHVVPQDTRDSLPGNVLRMRSAPAVVHRLVESRLGILGQRPLLPYNATRFAVVPV